MRKTNGKKISIIVLLVIFMISSIMQMSLINSFAQNAPKEDYSYNFDKYDSGYMHKTTEINKAFEGDASITVLTHGLGGDASNWSNHGVYEDEKGVAIDDYSFSYEKDSLIETLRRQENAEVSLGTVGVNLLAALSP